MQQEKREDRGVSDVIMEGVNARVGQDMNSAAGQPNGSSADTRPKSNAFKYDDLVSNKDAAEVKTENEANRKR